MRMTNVMEAAHQLIGFGGSDAPIKHGSRDAAKICLRLVLNSAVYSSGTWRGCLVWTDPLVLRSQSWIC
jgi:hypothetical protein